MKSLTVLYDAGCPICRAARRWLAARAQLVPLEFIAAGSQAARSRFPGLDHGATLREITVVADTGEVYVGDAAWLACLWALASHRDLSYRLSQPHLLPVARQIVDAAAAVRGVTRGSSGYGEADDRAQCDDERCG
jgi:predicted DCC family thiol-disulfide oxidoreductase YuxK